MLDFLKQFNWIDILVVILLFRICYIALKVGLATELFKISGTILGIYLALHYYVAIDEWMMQRMGAKARTFPFLSFCLLIIIPFLSYVFFVLVRGLFLRFMKMEAVPKVNKYGGFGLGIFRGILFISLIMYIFIASPFSYLKKSVVSSFSGKPILTVAPATYSWLWDSIISKFRAQEKFNNMVYDIQEELK